MFEFSKHPQIASPFLQSLGCQFTCDHGEVLVTLPFAPHLVGNPMGPAWHGGIIMAVLDIAAQAQLIAHIARPEAQVTMISSHADFLRSGQAETLYARARVRRAGRRYASVEAWVWQSEEARPTAMANVHFKMPSLS